MKQCGQLPRSKTIAYQERMLGKAAADEFQAKLAEIDEQSRKHPGKTTGQAVCQFHGNNSSSRCMGWSLMRARTSASQAQASTPFSLQVSISV
jgi:hypothetical protein